MSTRPGPCRCEEDLWGTADGHTVRQREITDEAVVVEQLVDLVREAAGLLGQATWFWAQTMNHEASRDISPM
jgi:hypothetical protein